MCGIVGVIGTPSQKNLDIFESMFTASVIRGIESSGVVGIVNNKVRTYKGTTMPISLMKGSEYKKIINNQNEAFIGHCRASTRGVVSVKNAHPFIYKNITLVHNGTLDWKLPTTEFNDVKEVPETDSETIAISIAERGIEATWKELAGSASLIYWDTKDNSFNFITNGKRPLCFGWSKNRDSIYVASEDWIIEKSLENNDEKLHGKVLWDPGVNYLYTIKLNKGGVSKQNKLLKNREEYLKEKYKKDEKKNKKENNIICFPKSTDSSQVSTNNKKTVWERIKGRWVEKDLNKNKKEQPISFQEFIKKYEYCIFCEGSLFNEYDTATIIDDDCAACNDCTRVADQAGMSLNTVVKGV